MEIFGNKYNYNKVYESLNYKGEKDNNYENDRESLNKILHKN